ncbi:MAG: CHASE2 domain-containing protein [Arcobacter sp.]|nr:CHASE2 domain-containing protein [Arcobacter sp.]
MKVKKLLIYSSIAFTLGLLLSFTYLNLNKLPDSFDNKLRDYFFTIRGEIANTGKVVIIDIDEKSLKDLGQWPWSRNKISQILNNLTQAKVAIIGMDIVFAEEDNSSPHKVFKKYNVKKENIPNYDLELSKTIQNTPTILGYLFELEKNKKYINNKAPNIPAIFIEKNKKLAEKYLINAYGTIINTQVLQDNSYSSGFFNNTPDQSGVTRSVPLLISYDDMIYPSLALEIVRILTSSKKVFVNYNENGVERISLNKIDIPTDRHGRILVNYRGKEKNFKYISASDIYYNKFEKKSLENKIVLIGTSAAGLLDLRATPFDFVFPGVEIHANVIDNIIQGDFLYKNPNSDIINMVLIFILSFLIVLSVTYTPFWLNPFILLFSLFSTLFFLYHILFYFSYILNIFFPLITILIAFILSTLLDYLYKVKLEQAIKKKFASKVSKEVMNKLLNNIDSNKFQAMEKEITVFFSDIRGFTKISESMNDAKVLILYLNQYMEPMSNIITKYEGTIDKYIGDAIMAYWNAPSNVKNHADKAVQTALKQIEELKNLNKKFEKENKPLIDIGIGINTGIATIGEMGSIRRSDYTVIGDSINLGSRLESLCKYYDSRINISNFTKDKLNEEYTLRFLDLVKVKGKEKPVEIWQVHNLGLASKELKEELQTYHKAIKLYKEQYFHNALKLFKKLYNNPNITNRKINSIYINRCKHFISLPPSSDFNGIYEHSTKS